MEMGSILFLKNSEYFIKNILLKKNIEYKS